MTSLVIGYLLGPYIVVHGYLAWCFYRIAKWGPPETAVPGITFQRFVVQTSLIASPLLLLELVPMCIGSSGLTQDLIAYTFPGTALKVFLALAPLTSVPPIPDHLRAPRKKPRSRSS